MVKLTAEIKESLVGTKLVYFATASKSGVPNAVPIGAFKLLDDETLLISDQYFNKTLANLKKTRTPVSPGGARRAVSRSREPQPSTPATISSRRTRPG